jgi:hypothetical protein
VWGDDAEVLVLACGPCHRRAVNDFRRPPKNRATFTTVQGEVGMSVDRTGEMPRITVDVPELLVLGLMLQSEREELGDTHPTP